MQNQHLKSAAGVSSFIGFRAVANKGIGARAPEGEEKTRLVFKEMNEDEIRLAEINYASNVKFTYTEWPMEPM